VTQVLRPGDKLSESPILSWITGKPQLAAEIWVSVSTVFASPAIYRRINSHQTIRTLDDARELMSKNAWICYLLFANTCFVVPVNIRTTNTDSFDPQESLTTFRFWD
jgi:hypothetical protein